MTNDTDEPEERVTATVPADAKRIAKEKLDHGGLSRVIRETIEQVAYGDEPDQRSRLEAKRDEARDRIRELREKRREKDARIETLEARAARLETKLGQLRDEEGEP